MELGFNFLLTQIWWVVAIHQLLQQGVWIELLVSVENDLDDLVVRLPMIEFLSILPNARADIPFRMKMKDALPNYIHLFYQSIYNLLCSHLNKNGYITIF